MKKIVSLLLALMLALSLAACGAKSAGSETMTGNYNGYDSTKEDYDFTATEDEAGDTGAWNGDGQVGSGIDKSLSERGVKMVYSASIEMQTLEFDRAAIKRRVRSRSRRFRRSTMTSRDRCAGRIPSTSCVPRD